MTKSLTRWLFVLAALGAWPLSAAAKDRALLIGIDRYRHEGLGRIAGCENDTELLKGFLISKLGFDGRDIRVMLNEEATEEAIRKAVRTWLIEETGPGDRVFFAYAGHGARVPDQQRDGDEHHDGMDEVLAVHDVVPKGPAVPGQPAIPVSGYITDDEVSRWVASLSGRHLVMLFDSCHSGTISRGAGGGGEHESRFLRFREEKGARGAGDVYSPDYDKSPRSRDVNTATEGFLEGAVEGVVIISAAKADQEAFPVRVRKHGRQQGALTYLFVEKQQGRLVPVESLQHVLNEGIEELKREGLLSRGRNGQYQNPQVEIHLHEQAALPIFGGVGGASWTNALAVALHNPLSKSTVEVRTADGRRGYSITRPNKYGKPGEMIPLVVKTSRPGYLYIWVFSRGAEGDVAKCLFPSQYERKNLVGAETISFPRCVDGRGSCPPEEIYEFFASKPTGTDAWVAIVTDQPIALRPDDYVYTWAEAFDRIGLEKVRAALSEYVEQATTRGAGVRLGAKPTVADWQADTLVLNALK